MQPIPPICVLAVLILVAPAGCADRPLDSPRPRPLVGAIRWDAWTGGPVTAEVERTLGPAKYHGRLPWFAQVSADGRVKIDGSPQDASDREIDFAAGAGLDYWAFLLYPERDAMSRSLANYLHSDRRGRIRFCLILHNSFGVSDEQWPHERDRAVALLKEPGYQTVLGGRPLVFAFDGRFLGGKYAERFGEFRRAAERAGLKPYGVYMGWDPAGDYAKAAAVGFDAVSAYAWPSDAPTYAALAAAVEKRQWQAAAAAGVPCVPLVTSGWDKRPRIDHPVSWELKQDYHRQKVFPAAPTPAELAGHLERALRFAREHPQLCPARAVIIYAWNEHDEGGWLCPTWTPGGPNAERLDAIRPVLAARSR